MFGDVFLCEFPFTSGSAGKIRPALILFDLKNDAVIGGITSVLRNGPQDVKLNDWASAGLLKPSIVRLDRIVTEEKTVLLKRPDTLNDLDLQAVRQSWNQNMRL
jgi:mRNA-degrading endonuclease toxin of MazEF toxin-antitoxin module